MEHSTHEIATFAGGCFWGVEAAFREIDGVINTQVGYTGGTDAHPTYEHVCYGDTGHAEAVEVTFDPSKISYALLLDRFFGLHDPTTRDRQGPDMGSQYRSAVYTHSKAQERDAREAIARNAPRFERPIVTEIVPAKVFWRAEEYHQRYVEKHSGAACRT